MEFLHFLIWFIKLHLFTKMKEFQLVGSQLYSISTVPPKPFCYNNSKKGKLTLLKALNEWCLAGNRVLSFVQGSMYTVCSI